MGVVYGLCGGYIGFRVQDLRGNLDLGMIRLWYFKVSAFKAKGVAAAGSSLMAFT